MNNVKKLISSAAIGLGSTLLISMSASATINTSDIANGAVTSAKIASNTIKAGNVAKGTLTGFQIKDGSIGNADLAFGAVTQGKIADGSVTSAKLASNIVVASDVTQPTSATSSFQNLAGNLTLEGAAGGTSQFEAGVMGHLHGDSLAPTASSNDSVYHGGVIGAYSVGTSDTAGTKAGLIGVIGIDKSTTVPDAAVMAVIDSGDGGATTADAAYGVAYKSANANSHFNYGLDLYHPAFSDIGANSAVEFGTADIRLQNGETISNGTDGVIAIGATTLALGSTNLTGSGSIVTTGAVDFGGATSLKVPSSAQGLVDNSGSCTTGRITYDTSNNHFFGCVNSVWQQLD